MLDIKIIREQTELVKNGIKAKNAEDNIDAILALDNHRRTLIGEGEALKAKRNEVSSKVGQMKKSGEDASGVIEEMNSVKT